MNKILITGVNGLLGSNFIQNAPNKYLIIGTYFQNPNTTKYKNVLYHQLDIRNKNNIENTIKEYKPDVVVHAASIGNVDICEKNKKDAYQTNVLGTKYLASSAKKIKAKFVFLSSNAVFDGDNAPYEEMSTPKPINFYGKTKFKAEKLIGTSLEEYTILRLNTMYGWHKKGERENPMTWILSRLKNKEKTYVVNDVYNSHLYVKSACEALSRVIEKWDAGAIYHIGGEDCISRYDFFATIADIFGYKKSNILPVDSTFFGKIAPRPKNTCFKLLKMQSVLNLKTCRVIEGLRDMKKALAKPDEKIN